MKLNINLEELAVPVSQALMKVISDQLNTKSIQTATSITLNFRDSTYSPTEGGYHPVEIGLHKSGEHWQLDYITDFAYVGNPYPELEKEIDFNFADGYVYVIFSGDFPFTNPDSIKLYEIWENNFISYVEMGCFDQIEVATVN
ncbi:TPA: DUF2787 domain-containing protein [Vibrio parahaemolyticus]|nr:DUF2787 domain-containing protein [Vibrio parahaemolyticus]HCE4677501.1 DUF2787 domain-containing protein [Vibrio parahaemolyticus]